MIGSPLGIKVMKIPIQYKYKKINAPQGRLTRDDNIKAQADILYHIY